ncbi:MAG TPA: nicotinate phosphoribosyltransferase, partial [Actinomycetaceae bacterium]|nr:nicotinate phosphoribosyltransferase [Actinomycetaceae bacterium]
ATTTKITVTSDLDEYAIAALGAAPVDSYGVGTKLVTGSGFPTAELVYKLVARENGAGQMEPVAKSSSAKESVGGQKCAGRAVVDNVAAEEIIVAGGSEEQRAARLAAEGARRLDELLVRDGEALEEHLDPQALPAAARRHVASRAELPYAAWRLSEGEPGIPTRHVNLDS